MIVRFLQAWFFATVAVTPLIGFVISWDSETLTIPLDFGLTVGFALAAGLLVFRK